MGLKVGIVGLPNVGKSTLFNALLGRQQALTAPYPFATVKPNIGVVDVPDERLEELHAALAKHPRSGVTLQTPVVYSTITFVDIAGLVKGAAQGQGLGNQFLSHIRDTDVILHVIRDFESSDVPRAEDSQNPEHDAEIVRLELELKDLEMLEREKKKKSLSLTLDPSAPLGMTLLAEKPVIYAINVDEKKLAAVINKGRARQLAGPAFSNQSVFYFSAKLEEQIAQLPKSEQQEYLKIYGLEKSCLDRMIAECFRLLGLISFFTAGRVEVRAWPVRQDSPASNAAGVIHSDFETLFIRAEVIDWEKLTQAGSWPDAKEKGWVRTEGRDYAIQDGDVCNFLIGK